MNTARKILLASATLVSVFATGCAQLDSALMGGQDRLDAYGNTARKTAPPPPVVAQVAPAAAPAPAAPAAVSTPVTKSSVAPVAAPQIPATVLMYDAFSGYNRATINSAVDAMGKLKLKAIGEVDKVVFNANGRTYTTEAVPFFRFHIPQESINDANNASSAAKAALEPLMATLGARLAEWNRTEPIELIVVSQTAVGADYLAAQMARMAPVLKVTKKVGTAAEAGYSGVELRMINQSLNRQIASAK
jgi:hypothetical protein